MRTLLLDLLYSLSSTESDSLNDDSDNDGSDSGSSGTCAFPLHFDESVGCVSDLGFGVFVPMGVELKCDVFTFVVFVPYESISKVVDS